VSPATLKIREVSCARATAWHSQTSASPCKRTKRWCWPDRQGSETTTFLVRGIAMMDKQALLAGALPAAAMALAFDEGLEWIERKLSPA
jgi:hypothetical protein